MKFDDKSRLVIFKALTKLGNIWGENPKFSKVDFLESIWNLRLMSSTDTRYRDAHGDATKHLIDNDDWEDEYTFLDRFNLLKESDETFVKFLNVVISPEVRQSENCVHEYLNEIEKFLPPKIRFSEVGKFNGITRYQIFLEKQVYDQYPIDVKPNDIPFYVDREPEIYPCFTLQSDGWDDFGFKTTNSLSFHQKNHDSKPIGVVKILQQDEYDTRSVLPSSFKNLEDTFCSLGQSEEYYFRLKELFPDKYHSILYALKDAAIYTDIQERSERNLGFKKSLLRSIEVEDILYKINRKLERGDSVDDWSFSFYPEIPYSDEKIKIEFSLGDLEDIDNPYRIKALIGPNGAGKTSILKSLVSQLIRKECGFEPYTPVFSKVIAISFSIFDTFINLRGKTSLMYCYCGLHDKADTIMSVPDREKRLAESLDWIDEKLARKYIKGLEIFFPQTFIDEICDDIFHLNKELIIERSKKMSSGESMILNLVTSLYANIRNNSLIVFDELEVHLHPAAIRKMMALVFRITRQFHSACILATHSSIVVQELLADNVLIIEKDEFSKPTIRSLNRESLGENLSLINDEIFGCMTISPSYKRFLLNKAEESKTFKEMLDKISSRGLPPGLNLYMLARETFRKSNSSHS